MLQVDHLRGRIIDFAIEGLATDSQMYSQEQPDENVMQLLEKVCVQYRLSLASIMVNTFFLYIVCVYIWVHVQENLIQKSCGFK